MKTIHRYFNFSFSFYLRYKTEMKNEWNFRICLIFYFGVFLKTYFSPPKRESFGLRI